MQHDVKDHGGDNMDENTPVISRRDLIKRAAVTAALAAAGRDLIPHITGASGAHIALGAEAARAGGTLMYALDQPPNRLDPNLSGQRTAQIVMFQMFDPLLVRDKKDHTFKPWLATSWDVSRDGKAYTFRLRRDVKFHDGTPFNAEAVKFNFDRTHNPALGTGIAGVAVGFYGSSEIVDPSTVRIHLKKPWGPFLNGVSLNYRMVSPAGVQKVGDKDFGQHPVGTGAFRFVEWIPNEKIVLERNPDFTWAPSIFKRRGPALLDRITYKIIPEATTRVAALQAGEAHVITAVPAQDFQRLNRDPRFRPIIGIAPGMGWVWAINVTKAPTDELAVRQALNYGVDREAVAKVVYGSYQAHGAFRPSYGPLVPSTWSYEKGVEIYRYNPGRAKDLLEKAGWKVGSDGIRQKAGKRLEIGFNSWDHGIPEVVQSQLKAIGIDLKVGVLDTMAVNAAQEKQQSHMSPIPAARADPDILSDSLHSRNIPGDNYDFVRDSVLDKLLDDAAAEVNTARREQLYKRIQKRIMDMAYLLPVTTRDNATLTSAKVRDLEFDSLGFFPWLHDVWLQQ